MNFRLIKKHGIFKIVAGSYEHEIDYVEPREDPIARLEE